MHALIFANGDLADTECPRSIDLVICADGGTRHTQALGLVPDTVVGDLDSLSADLRQALETGGVRFVAHPQAKDETDLELALLHAVEQGAEQITVLGVRGGRLDHELANLLVLAHPALRGVDVRLRAGGQEVRLIMDERTFTGKPGDLLSLLPIGGDAHGVTTEGLEYALYDDTLLLGPARGVSNVFAQVLATVRVRSGLILAVHTCREEV
jgi:thiamine pyrophosphokinase